MELVLVKRTDARLPDAEAEVVRRFLFQHIDGVGERDRKAWRSFWRAVAASGSGEYFTIVIKRRRNTKFHRLSFAVQQAVFKAQERFEDMRIFRSFLKLGAGFCDYIPNADGELRAVPKSVSFEECSEEEMRQFHDDMIAFLRTERAQKTLWPNAAPKIAAQGIETILEQFERSLI